MAKPLMTPVLTITAQQLSQILPMPLERANKFIASLNEVMAKNKINTVGRVAAFLANVGVESANLSVFVENLNYSAEALARVWPKRFANADKTPNALAKQIARNSKLIANTVYASRMGNGDSTTGDGFRYRGRGAIQVTGKDNYRACGVANNIDLVAKPELLEDSNYALVSAGWYWSTNNINKAADAGDFDGCRDAVNIGRKTAAIGDAHGYKEAKASYDRALMVL